MGELNQQSVNHELQQENELQEEMNRKDEEAAEREEAAPEPEEASGQEEAAPEQEETAEREEVWKEDKTLQETTLQQDKIQDRNGEPKPEEKPIKKKRRRKKKKQNGKRKKQKIGTQTLVGCGLLLAAVLIAVGTLLFFTFRRETVSGEPGETVSTMEVELNGEPIPQETETEPEEELLAEEETETETIPEEEPTVKVPESEREGFVKIESCLVLPDSKQFGVKASVEMLPASDDDYYYLFALATYQETIPEGAEPIAQIEKEKEFMIRADVNESRADSRLYDKFVVSIKEEGQYVALSKPVYITNPEALAGYTAAYPHKDSIKGLLVDPLKIATSELDELGVNHAVYNIPLHRILGPTTNGYFPTINYTYNGKNYVLNGAIIDEYDYVFRTLTQKGIVISAVLLNSKSSHYPELIHPLSRNGSGYYYAFNASEQAGCDALEAVAAFLAERYRDSEHGVVMNWIVGNEVNVRSSWNYMQYVDLDTYAREYARAFRTIYNAIKSMNANARVYISLDQQWNRNRKSQEAYDARDLLDEFNEFLSEEGNIDWGVAYHPYSVPLTWPKFWSLQTDFYRSLVLDSPDTSMVTMSNIHVVTDYLQRPEFLTSSGEVRSVILSELGYTSSYGEDVQAAAFAYTYYIAENNQHIDALVLSRQTDAASEVAEGLALGICHSNGQRKYVYEVFKYIDTEYSAQYTEFAKAYIGIQSWDQVIRKR